MVGGGSFGWEPGEWTDDTSMAIAIAEVAATGADLRKNRHSTPSPGAGMSSRNAPKTLVFRLGRSSAELVVKDLGSEGSCKICWPAQAHWSHRGQ